MKQTRFNRILAVVLALLLVATLLPASMIAAWAAGKTYVLDFGTMDDVPQYSKADGDSVQAGTDGYFNVFFANKSRLEPNSKNFSDGFSATKRMNYGGETNFGDVIKNAVQFKTSGPATVKIWWVSGGDGREVGLYNGEGTVLSQTNVGSVKNSLYISQLEVSAAGTYYIGNVGGNNNHYKIEVAESGEGGGTVERTPWADVAAPVISAAADNGEGQIDVIVSAVVGDDGGDELIVTMLDAQGKELESRRSVAEKGEHKISFAPSASGTYSFKAELKRDGEKAKTSETVSAEFVLLLQAPVLVSATNKGNGSVELVWGTVAEATGYDVYCNGEKVGNTTKLSYTVKGLSVGSTCTFKVAAVRGEESKVSNELSVKITKEEQRAWGFTVYGPSTNEDNNGYVGDLNADGKVTVYSEGGKGKIVPASTDGLAFYYTAIPTEYNFTLRATVTVDSWTLSNGQEGFGLMATDRLGVSGDKSAFWNNQYMALCSKIEYRYEGEEVVASGGTKYSMKMGLGVIEKVGVTKKNLSKLEASDTNTINKEFSSTTRTLEWAAGEWEKEAGTYNIVGNYTSKPEGTIENELKTTFILEIQKNNTGYFITYYSKDGKVLCRQKYYDPKALSKLDTENVYVGFFAARNARATFSNVTLTTILASKDAPAEEKPVTKIDPTVSISSGNVTTSGNFELLVDTNVNGTAQILVDDKVVLENVKITGEVRYRTNLTFSEFGEHRVRVQFTPDPNQDLGEDTVLSSTKDVFADIIVTYNKGNYHTKVIYVSPDGLPNGNGSKEFPFDIYTAVANVVPGQTIVLMEGTYKLIATVRIQRGMDGTEENPIRLIADPEAATRPVLDFQRECAGIVHGGDYWYFYGFDVTNTADALKGFQVSGNYNVLDQIRAYYNGSTGIQISRYASTDKYADWPVHNLVLNCDSYCNYDKGFEDADGFAAKLTVGEGNVFDGCVAYNNADDGWDLYAKKETGSIGAVVVRNCVAYSNGFVPGVEGKGNGNGFKLGGESLSGKHVLENSYAFFNLHKGIDSNSCPDIIVKNCVSYNNGSYNVAFYTNDAGNTNFVANGIVSFRDSTSPYDYTGSDNLKGKGSQSDSKYLGKSNYYWQGDKCVNSAGKTVKASMFVTLTFPGQIARKADGTLDMQGFLVLNDTAPDGAGATMGGQASRDNSTLPQDDEHNYSDVYSNLDQYNHWRECDCGYRTDLAEHTFTWVIDKEPTPETTGLKHEECTVCGFKRAAITTYYEEKQPDPTQPGATEPAPTEPAATEPKPTEPVGGNVEKKDPTTLIVILAIVAALTVGTAVVLAIKKKKK